MNGILIMDKPAGFTSFDVVAKLRGICNTKKIGHGGTLDPMATGVLPVFIGAATKAVDLQPRHDKTYEATLQLGVLTDTGDITGTVIAQAEVNAKEADVQRVLPAFLGESEQLPPMVSAVKINGKPLYRYAREGKTVERKLRPITIHSIEYLGPGEEPNQFKIRVHCSKGSYIRVLVEDIGKALGLPATLAALRRTQAGMFTLARAHTLPGVQQARDENRLETLLLPVQTLFEEMPRLELSPANALRLRNGAPVYGMRQPQGRYAVYNAGTFLALAMVGEDGLLQVEKMFGAIES